MGHTPPSGGRGGKEFSPPRRGRGRQHGVVQRARRIGPYDEVGKKKHLFEEAKRGGIALSWGGGARPSALWRGGVPASI